MTNNETPSELVQRLHRLRVSKSLTIQQMAEACGLPKSSLESYMRMSGAKRPGIDALIAVADGMSVSLDWLVGRSNEKNPSDNDKRKYALAAFDVVLELLRDIENAQAESSAPVIQGGEVSGRSLERFAALTMLQFASRAALLGTDGEAIGADVVPNLEAILEAALDRKPETD